MFSGILHLKIDFFSKFLVFSDPKLVENSVRYGSFKVNPFYFLGENAVQ